LGARALIDPAPFPGDRPGTPYLAPQVLIDVDHGMRVMTEESFGPVVGIMPVDGDDHAVALMNDSVFGLTASIWTADVDAALAVGDRVETGTWYLNSCDYLDPALAWTAGGIQLAGSSPATSRSRNSRASLRSVLARCLRPRAAWVSAGSARCASNPAASISSTT
jgi:acyl-CoA reductase-like NAD-dependent aldehyde dehydrogenase